MKLKLVIISILIVVCSYLKVCSGRGAFPDATNDNFQNECLQAHNKYRALHNSPSLTIDQNIVAYAKSRCRSRSQYQGLSAGHSGLASGYGENLYWGGNSRQAMNRGADAVKSWYDENRSYRYGNPGFSFGTGHFTQVVWKSTTRIGCARCAGWGSQWYETYIVCNYQPAGNYQGQFSQNVLRPYYRG